MKLRRESKLRFLWLMLLVSVTVLWGGAVQAAWLDNVPITVVQPNGDTLHVFATGDEFYHYMHDADGYTIVQNPETGYYVYADKVDGKLVATQLIVGRSNPTRSIRQPRLTISNEEYRQRRLEIEGSNPYKVSPNRSPNANRGNINHIVIFISFADDPEITTKSFSEVDYLFNETSAGARSVYNYFKTASYNQMHITSSFYPQPDNEQILSYTDAHSRDYYSPHSLFNSQGYRTKSEAMERKNELLINTLEYVNANNLIPTDLELDFDGDGKVDVITFAVNSNVDAWSDLLWPHKSSFNENINVRINGKQPCLYTFELIKSDYFYLNTFCHELTHVFGAPDFYHADKSSDNPNPIGKWDIMCNTHDDDMTGEMISNASAYIKWKYLNWIDDIPVITEPGAYSLQTLGNHNTNNAYRIASSVPNQYYVLEYRYNNEPFDENGYGTGLVIYRVNEDATGNCYSYPKYGIYDELYVFRPNGSVEDVGQLGNSFFSIESGRVSFGPNANPCPFLSDGTLDELNIEIVSMTGSEMTFQYSDSKMPPSNFAAIASGRTVSMSWTGCSEASSYTVYREKTELATVTSTTYIHENAICGTHSYYVKANYGSGQSRTSNVEKVTIVYNGPDAISDLVASIDGNGVNLEWTDIAYQSYMLKHHTTPSSAETMKCNNATECIWFERFSSEELSAHAGMVLKNINVYIAPSAVNKIHYLYFCHIPEPSYRPSYMEFLHTTSFTPTSEGWIQVWIDDEVDVDYSQDLYVGLRLEDNGGQYAAYQTLLTTSTESFLWEGGESYVYLRKIGANQHWLITLSVQYPNFTYNVYRNDGHRTTCIAHNLETPNYTDTNVPTGFYTYYVTTNYYGGESEPSNEQTVSIGNYTVITSCSPIAGGSISGNQGSYPAGGMVTLTASANTGYAFNGWMESGQVVCNSPTYTFQAMGNRNLVASFRDAQFDIGNVVTNPDGSQGVVFHLNPNGTEGWMVALNDASEGCTWGEATNVLALQEVPFNSPLALEDLSGYRNTGILRTLQGTESEYAAATVDYDNGWYLPSSGQLRKLYSALPFIEEAITAAGGTTLTEGTYWSSSEYSASDAFVPSFAMSNTGKTATCRVRAIRNFVTAGNNAVVVASNDNQMGMASVSGNGTFAYGATATVTATPNAGYAFDHWSEDGVAVSYDAVYQFTFTRSRSLVAHFTVPGSVGSIVVNADGSKGVVFWLDPDGDQGLMVALDDASEGCAWGEATDALTLLNKPFNSPLALEDVSGNTNTRCIRKHQGTENEYAASLVDFENGWYLPSVGELRKLYAALPMVEPALSVAGGNTLTEDTYWSSTEYSATDAATATFSMGNTGKTGTCRVRAIRHFATASPNAVTAKPDNLAFGTVTGSGEYTTGQTVTVTAMPNTGYAFNAWTENGMIVSLNPTYQFSFTRSRCLEAHFVVPGSVGSIVTNSDGSRGVVFYTDPSGISGWMVALEDDSEGCAWGNAGEDVLALDNLNPSQTIELLTDMDGRRNSRIMRGWFVGQTGYAANEVDYNNQWFLPTAGQLRKLYAALPMVEPNLVNAEGSLLTDDAYWSSTERSANEAWSPSFAFGSSNKGENRRVRAIRSFYTANVQHTHVFVGTNGTLWSDPTNWINPSRNLLDNDDDVIITTQCVVDEDATVSSLTMAYGSTISVDEGRRLAVTEDIHNTYDTRINLGLGSQLVNPTEGTYFSMSKEIEGYGDSEDGGWYTIATPLKDGMGLGTLTAGTYDLYVYDEPTHYWLNQKVENNNITTLQNGLGYLYAHQVATTLNFTGQAKSSSDEYLWSVSNTATAAPLNGFNLLGNPFTSDIAIGNLRANGAALSAYYKVSNGNALVAYTDADDEPIRPAEGFFVQAQAGNVSFNTATRGTAANGYVRLVLTENGKMLDRAYLKVTEGGGLPKLRMNEGASELYFRQEDIDFAVAERREDVMEYPLYFKALHNGSYTIAADLLNTDCDYLHLIDNLTGADVNLLTSQSTEDCGTESAMTAGRMSYTFTAKTTDYASRFRLVFSGSADGPSADGQPIAYYADGEIRLLADARGASLQVMDMLGRVVRVFTDAARNISTTGMPAGVYVLRLISGDNVKTQKVIVN